MTRILLISFSLLLPLTAIAEESKGRALFGKVTDAVTGTVEGVGGVVGNAADKIAGTKTPAEMRAEVDGIADSTLRRLKANNKFAKALFEKSYGYAVFDTHKFSFLLTSGSGVGVVVEKPTKKRTYMHMATAGAGVGMGMQFYQLVILFENKESLDKFMSYGVAADAAAAGAFGKDQLNLNTRFVNGTAVYQLSDKGIMAAANVTGTKYWKSAEMNGK